jgi:type VI secretion system protein ImpG
MPIDDKIYQAYLEELQQIEKFRGANSNLFEETPLNSDDPYTKRLIEAIAFFGARARLQGVKRMTMIHQRLFRQYFPYLVNPLPAIAMMQATPSLRFPQKVVLPAGSELIFKTSNQQKASFQTLSTLDVVPIFQKKFELTRTEGRFWRCTIEYAALHTNTEEVGTLKLFINHLNSFYSSLKAAFAMQCSLEKVQVFYDSSKLEAGQGYNCTVHFGTDHEDSTVFRHEFEKLRSLLHLPQQELYISFEIPPLGKNWKTMTLCLDFNEHWPESIKLNADSLIPFVVPVVNFKKAYADPIVCDGTKDSHPVLYPEAASQSELHTVIAVSLLLSQGAKTLNPGILGFGSESYEIDYFNQQISLDLPEAFIDPKTISILALWTQPWFSNYFNDELELHFNEAQSFGLGVRLLGPLYRHEKTIEDDPNFLIRILSLKNQNHLNLSEILFILNSMKKLGQSFFDAVPDWIQDLKIHQKMDKRHLSSVIEYEFFLKDWGGQRWEAGLLFFKYIHRMLNCWLPNFEIETKVHFPQIKKPLIIKQGKQHELSAMAGYFFLSQ